MAFPSPFATGPAPISSGERYGSVNVILTARAFENNLVVGRFAKMDAGRLDNMDASATPVIAGVVLRKASNPVEDENTIDNALFLQCEYLRSGCVTVDAVTGETPTPFAPVFAVNTAGANAGKATVTVNAANLAARAEFIEVVGPDTWLIRLI